MFLLSQKSRKGPEPHVWVNDRTPVRGQPQHARDGAQNFRKAEPEKPRNSTSAGIHRSARKLDSPQGMRFQEEFYLNFRKTSAGRYIGSF